MNKFTSRLLLILVILGAGYTGYWYYQTNEIKKEFEKIVLKFSDKISKEENAGVKFDYTNITSAGFPFKSKISLEGVKLSLEEKLTEKLGFLKELRLDKVAFSKPIFGNTIGIHLPTEMFINIDQAAKNALLGQEAPEDQNELRFTYYQEPVFEIQLVSMAKAYDLLSMNRNNNIVSAIIDSIKSVYYQDQGGKAYRGDEVVYDAAYPSTMKVDIDKQAINFYANSRLHPASFDFAFQQKLKVSDKTPNFTIDLRVATNAEQLAKHNISENDLTVSLKDFSIQNKDAGVVLKGEILKTTEDALPFGKIVATITDYEEVVDQTIVTMREFFENVAALSPKQGTATIPALDIKDEYIAIAKQFIKAIADDPTNDSKDVSITVQREKGADDIKVGTLSQMDLVMTVGQLVQSFMPQSQGTEAVIFPEGSQEIPFDMSGATTDQSAESQTTEETDAK
jgi:hypothetical protein